MLEKSGVLSIVATPIGNLDDISQRAIETLKSSDIIAAEDTRHSKRLLSYYNIDTPLQSYHDYSSEKVLLYFIDQLLSGKHISLISDAGTPLIADPGYRLVKMAHKHDIKVNPLPGPCALITALCASGLPSDKFLFTGFLPAKSTARKSEIATLASITHTWIFYESPYRIVNTLNDLLEIIGPDRKIVLGRELTKRFETIICDSVLSVREKIINDPNQSKGEFVVLVHGCARSVNTSVTEEVASILKILMEELPFKQSCALTAKITGLKKRDLYEYGLTLKP